MPSDAKVSLRGRLSSCAHAVGAGEVRRVGIVIKLSLDAMQQVANAPAHRLGTQIHQRATTFFTNRTQRRSNGILTRTPSGAKHIPQHVTAMHSDQDRIVNLRDVSIGIGQTNATQSEGQMGQRVNRASERNQIKRTFRGVDHGAGEFWDR